MEAAGPFLLTALALAGSPGPNTLSLAAVGASFGRARGLEYMAGLTAGMGLVIAIVGSGVAGVVWALPGADRVIGVLAGAYFLYLAVRIATAPPLGDPAAGTGAAPRWFEGVGLSLVNPKAYAAMAAALSGHVLVEADTLADFAVKAVLLLATILAVNITWLSLGAMLTRHMRDPRTSRIVNITFAALLVASVLLVAIA